MRHILPILFLLLSSSALFAQAGMTGFRLRVLPSEKEWTKNEDRDFNEIDRNYSVSLFTNMGIKEHNFCRLRAEFNHNYELTRDKRRSFARAYNAHSEKRTNMSLAIGYGTAVWSNDRFALLMVGEFGVRYHSRTRVWNSNQQHFTTTSSFESLPRSASLELSFIPTLQWKVTRKLSLGLEMPMGPIVNWMDGTRFRRAQSSERPNEVDITTMSVRQRFFFFYTPRPMLTVAVDLKRRSSR